MSLRELDEDLWILDGPRVRMLGIPFTTRMTIIRLTDGGLWLHSPVAASEGQLSELEALGPIRHLVAPNKFHHRFLPDWMARYPYATSWAGPQLRERVPIQFDHELADTAEACWAADLDQLLFGGSRVLPEAVFYHRSSRTLILTDIFQSHEPDADGWLWRTVKRINGISAPHGGVPRDWQTTVSDRAAARAARDRMLGWGFDRLVITHGRCIERGARAQVERAFAWLDER